MSRFNEVLGHTLNIEGGYVDDPKDRGGETYKGIARKHWPQWRGWELIDAQKVLHKDWKQRLGHIDLLDQYVAEFYKAEFWDRMNLDLIVNPNISEKVFDTGVNMGNRTAVKFLQEAYNLSNQNGKLGADLKVDGALGPKTAAAINSFSRVRVMLKVLNLLQGERYLNICRNDSSQERFLHGWVKHRILL